MNQLWYVQVVCTCGFWIASFLGSFAPEREIELVHVERAWYFFHMRTLEGRKAVERP